jgi:3-hydroxyisobutyrate dehydrogenase
MGVGVPMPLATLARAFLQTGMNMIGPNASMDALSTMIDDMAGVREISQDNALRCVAQYTPHEVPSPPPVIGYVGLGAMGSAIARQARRVARELHVYDVKSDHVAALVKDGARAAGTLVSLAEKSDIIMICVPTSADVREILFGKSGMANALTRGKIVIDQTTGNPNDTQALAAQLRELGVELVDAPVSGGPRGAADGTLITFCGGSIDVYSVVQPLLEKMTGNVSYFGPSGSGHAAKIVKNSLGSGNRLIVYEALSLAMKLGIPLNVLESAIGRGPAWSAAFMRVLSAIRTGQATADITLRLLGKDLDLISRMAVHFGSPMMISNAARVLVESAIRDLGPDVKIDALGAFFGIHTSY